MNSPVLHTEIPGLPAPKRGKVRDIYDLGDALLLVATDRISAFDVIMPNGIPDKGRVLTQISNFWFQKLASVAETHVLATQIEEFLPALEKAGAHVSAELRETLDGRSLLGVKTQALPIECVVRGYMAGSLWKEYRQAGGVEQGASLYGYAFPAGLQESGRLPEPIFTPATKAEEGHDENISVAQAAALVGEEMAQALLEKSVAIYRAAAEFALQQGILLADTKFEFGVREGKLIWIDEALTPDSSRFWDDALYAPGHSQPSYDKQFVRDWLEASGWNKQPPAPTLPADIVEKTAEKYREAYRRLTGETLK